MTYVATQLIVWIVLAFLLGLAVGWFGRGRRKPPGVARRKF
jgi:hypothetical protein